MAHIGGPDSNFDNLVTPEQRAWVEASAACDKKPHKYLASMVINPLTGRGISPDTLNRVFRQELDRGMFKKKSCVLKAMYDKAIDGDVQAARTWLAYHDDGYVNGDNNVMVVIPDARLTLQAKIGRINKNSKIAAEIYARSPEEIIPPAHKPVTEDTASALSTKRTQNTTAKGVCKYNARKLSPSQDFFFTGNGARW